MLRKLQALFVKTVNHVENQPVPFTRYYFLFAAILFVRLTLEFFSSRRLFSLDDILHIGLWFIFIVLAFLLQLQLFSGEKIVKVAKLVIVFFSIALTAPIIDLLITGGVGAKMNYLSLHSWKDVAWSYLTVGGSSLSRGATPGIRIEIVLLVIASFNYVRTKTGNIIRAIIAAICIYTILFLSGAVPLLLGHIVQTFQLQYEPDDQSTVLLLLSADILLFCFAISRYSPAGVINILKATPWMHVLLCLVAASLGAWLAIDLYPGNWQLTPTTLFWFPLLLACLVFFSAYAAVQKLEQKENVQQRYAMVKHALVLLLLLITALLSAKIFFAAALTWGLLLVRNEAPLQLNRIPVLGNLLEAMVLLAAALCGFSIFKAPMIGFPPKWILIILVAGSIGSLLATFLQRRKSV